jgi:hypothetical protein
MGAATQPEIKGPSPDDASPVDVAVWDDCIVLTSRRRLDITTYRTVIPFGYLDMIFQARLTKLLQQQGVKVAPNAS